MGRLFGTDGARGIANDDLTCELAMAIGRAAAHTLTRHNKHKARIVIGKDTRVSGDMLESALAAGMCSVGADVVLLGVIPTPAVAYLVKKYSADAGVVISASHNPVEFNGIKLFNSDGFKLADELEDEIEAFVKERSSEIELKTHGEIGSIEKVKTAVDDYVDYLVSCASGDLKGLKIAVDCANGASSETAKKLFARLGADCVFTGDAPDGRNINDGVGSTHLGNVRALVLSAQADVGVAFDGDADRCLAVDEKGNEIDGDRIIALFAEELKNYGRLAGDTVVVTVMTNLGFIDFCKRRGINAVRTAVGDRYVLEEMRAKGYCIGGEQSGHIIMTDYSTTGDGELTAVKLLRILKKRGCRASELAGDLVRYPQLLINVTTTPEGKQAFLEDSELAEFVKAQDDALGDSGRVLVRVSGTEPLIRIMVEGTDDGRIKDIANAIREKINERIKTR